MPGIGAGTWNLAGETLADSLRTALDAGYTHVDTAEGYMNESEIGDVLTDYEREELFLTSKVLPKHLDYESVIESCEASLERLGTDYLDLYLVHWPNPAISVRETMAAMAHLKETGKVRNVGVSNFSPYQLSTAQHVSDVPIAVNQVEFHPWHQRADIIEACEETDTVVEAAAPLGRTDVFGDDVVRSLADERDVHPAQIILRWEIERGVVPLPKSGSPAHVRANLELFDFELDEEDIERLNGRDKSEPVYDNRHRDWSGDVYGISQ